MVGLAGNLAFAAIDMLKTMLKDLQTGLTQNTPVLPPTDLTDLIRRIQDCAEGKTPPETQDPMPDVRQDIKLEPIRQPESSTRTAPAASVSADAAGAARQTIKVSTKRLDDLINMTGELAVAQLMISEEVSKTCHTDSDLFRKVAGQSKIVRELQELSMAMRMILVQRISENGPSGHDPSKKAAKPVVLQTSGEETEFRPNHRGQNHRPLIHMLRNSIDHGIEVPRSEPRKEKIRRDTFDWPPIIRPEASSSKSKTTDAASNRWKNP